MTHKFQVHLHGLIELLSDHLYSEPKVFVRELLQNGVDAIRARTKIDPEHVGEIVFEVIAPKGKMPTLIVTDNGIGLNEEEVHKFLATIGESSKRAARGQGPTDYIGQFGIGILSCFVVSAEIVVISRSAKEGSAALEWRARPDGTYDLKSIDRDLAPGTQVCLTAKPELAELFDAETLIAEATRYGGLLPYPIRVVAGKRSQIVNDRPAPWRQRFSSAKNREKALFEFGREAFRIDFFDAIPIRSKVGDVDGIAYVLPFEANLAARREDRVYLKNMLLSERADNLLPEWAFFVKAVVNANDLRPTASRESFYEDRKLEAARVALGDCLRNYIVDLAEKRPEKMMEFLGLHSLALKALAVQDEEFYKMIIDSLPFETTAGAMTFGEYRRENETVSFAATTDQFRNLARVAAAQQRCIINGGYTYDSDLLRRASDLLGLHVAEVESRDLAEEFEELDVEEHDRLFAFLEAAAAALRPFRCEPSVKKFRPAEIPVLFSSSKETRYFRSLEQSKEIANPLWAGVLDNLGSSRKSAGTGSQLIFNGNNPLIQKLAQVKGEPMLRRVAQMLYVQALMLSQEPLTSKELQLLNDGLLDLIGWGIADGKGAP